MTVTIRAVMPLSRLSYFESGVAPVSTHLIFEGNFEDYKADKPRRLGPDSVEPKRIKYKKFAR